MTSALCGTAASRGQPMLLKPESPQTELFVVGTIGSDRSFMSPGSDAEKLPPNVQDEVFNQ